MSENFCELLSSYQAAICPSEHDSVQFPSVIKELHSGNDISLTNATYTDDLLKLDHHEPNVTLPYHTVFSLNGPRTYSIWLRANDGSTVYFRNELFQFYLFRDGSTVRTGFYAGNMFGNDYVVKEWVIDNNDLNHCCFVWDGTDIDLYLNGVFTSPINSLISGSVPLGTSAELYFRCDDWGQSGFLDDFRAYNRVLSEDEIELLAEDRGICLLSENNDNNNSYDYYYYDDDDNNTNCGNIHAWDVKAASSPLISVPDAIGDNPLIINGSASAMIDDDFPAIYLPYSVSATSADPISVTDFTISLWFSSNYWNSIAEIGNSQIYLGDTNQLHFYVNGTHMVSYAKNYDQWYHVAASYNYSNGQVRCYVDGIPIGLQTGWAEHPTSSEFVLHDNDGYSSTYYNNILLYNEVLSSEDIAHLASSRTATIVCLQPIETTGAISLSGKSNSLVNYSVINSGGVCLSGNSDLDPSNHSFVSQGKFEISGRSNSWTNYNTVTKSTAIQIDSKSVVRVLRRIGLVRVPEGAVTEDLNAFYLGIVFDDKQVNSSRVFAIDQQSLREMPCEIRKNDGKKLILYFSCNLYSSRDNDFEIWEVVE